jgi:hypothetical protein
MACQPRRNCPLRALLALGFLFCIFPGIAASLQGADESIRLSVNPVRQEVTLGEPIWFYLLLENQGAERVVVDLGNDQRGNLTVFAVSSDGGKERSRARPWIADGGHFSGDVSIAPGKGYSSRLLLADWVELVAVGEYVVTLEWSGPSVSDSGAKRMAPLRDSIFIRVIDRDPGRLEKICEELADEVLQPKEDFRLDAERALGYLNDDSCTPALARVLRGESSSKEGAIKGLARTGSSAAILTLVQAWDELRWDQQMQANQVAESAGKLEALQAALTSAGKIMARPDW